MSADLSALPPQILALSLATADEETAERIREEMERRRVAYAARTA